jgi:uncharacterized metal-binding protein YceD (DUF177 family)
MSGNRFDAPLLDAAIRIDHIPAEGREIEVRADAAQRQAIAERLQISAVDRLDARLRLVRFKGGMRVAGRIAAATVQPCVVSFVPVCQEIDEPFDRIYLPAADQPPSAATHPEVFVDLEADLPDYFEGHEVDLSEAIVETLALALDPYPRAEGVSLTDAGLPLDEPEPSPFAGLRSLLDPDDKG